MDAYTKLSQTFATALSDLRRDCATSPPLASRALVPVSPPRPTANSSFSSGGAEPHHQRSRGVVDACTAHATLARLRALVESKTRSTALHAHSSSPTAPGAAAAAAAASSAAAAAAAAPASAAPAATVFHTGLHAALAQLPTNTEIERAGEKLHSAVRLASKCTAAAPVEDTSIWGRAMPDNTVPLPAVEGSRSGSPSRAWRTLGAGASAEQQQQQPGAQATDGSEAQLVEERLSRLYLQLLDAERRALEAACEARSLRREEEDRQQQQHHHLSTTHSSQARQRSPSPQRAPPPPPPPQPPLQPLSPQPHQHALLAPNSPPSPGEAVLQILRNPHLCSFVRQKPAAAPWRGSRYNAWRPNSVDYAESSRKFGRGSSSSSSSSSSSGGGGGGGGRRAVVPPPPLPQRK